MTSSLSDDLNYIRDLAEAGQSAPLLGGRFLALWGGLVTLAYIGHYIALTGQFGATPVLFAIVWASFLVVGIFAQVLMVKTFPADKPGASSIGNRVEGVVWGAGGFALSAYFGTVIVKSVISGQPDPGFEWSLPLVFAVYSIGLLTSGVLANNRVLTIAGYGSLAMIALAAWFVGTAEIWLVGALAGFATFFVPGILMMRQEPKSVV
ncbi:MAG: hypothetical protein AAFZ91_02200 [Pseudomonadota bacterium]